MTKAAKLIKVLITEQRVEAYSGSDLVFNFSCVSGDAAHPTDRGVFKVIRKEHPYKSKTYHVQMDHALFFTDDGKALHQYHGLFSIELLRACKKEISQKIGSHGCVRLSESDAKALFDWTPMATPVHVV